MDCCDTSAGQFRDFKRDDFEAEWTKVAEGRFGHVYQVKVKLWREKCALKTFDATLSANNFYRYEIHSTLWKVFHIELFFYSGGMITQYGQQGF